MDWITEKLAQIGLTCALVAALVVLVAGGKATYRWVIKELSTPIENGTNR